MYVVLNFIIAYILKHNRVIEVVKKETELIDDKIIAISKNLTKGSIMMKLIPLRTQDRHEMREGRDPDVTGRDGTEQPEKITR